jgi:Ser/Thr protein kinase RdoA (MazF antagonist)
MKTSFPFYEIVESRYAEEGAEISSVSELGGHGINSRNYRIEFTGEGESPIHLKVIDDYDETLIEKLRVFRRCHEGGVKVAQVVPARGGELFIEEEGRLIVCFRYYEGSRYSNKREEAISAARELGRLNGFLSGVDAEIPRGPLYDPLDDSELREMEAACKRGSRFDKEVLKYLAGMDEIAGEVKGTIDSINEKACLENIDYHPDNVLFSKGSVIAILDFDSIYSVPGRYSVAFACDRFSTDVAAMIDFISAYREIDGDLTVKDIGKFPDYIIMEAMGRINYILRSYYLLSSDAWNFDFIKHTEIIRKTLAVKERFLDGAHETFS